MDSLSPQQRRFAMQQVKSEDTTLEKVVRSYLHRQGFRYRLHVKSLPGKPDIVLPKYRTIIDVRGCFWHQHVSPTCTRNKSPKAHSGYWSEKFRKNVERDKQHERDWRALGWKVIVVWECEASSEATLRKIVRRLKAQKK